jgi:two-component system chemotaxis response regulator CheB
MQYDAVAIGVSAGGLAALHAIIPLLGNEFPVHVLIVQHMGPDSKNFLVSHLTKSCRCRVKEAEDKDRPQQGTVYVAPPNYHLLVEEDKSLALSTQERVNFSRPSIDVMFTSAAEAHQDRLVGVVLTGANNDGTAGLGTIKKYGGLTIVQAPETAAEPTMPRSAITAVDPDHVLPLEDIGPFLRDLFNAY